MGDHNQYLWIDKYKSLAKGPILEIGSKFYSEKTSMPYRKLFPGTKYVGVDMEQGENVDFVVDFTTEFATIQTLIGLDFNSVICCSVMEHVKDIYAFSKNVTNILKPGGILFLSVPFTWEFHGYPNDFWRFTPPAIEFLFPEFQFSVHKMEVSSSIDGESMVLEKLDDLNTFVLHQNVFEDFERKNSGPLRLVKKLKSLMQHKEYRKEFVIRKMLGREYRMSLSCINMIGIKK